MTPKRPKWPVYTAIVLVLYHLWYAIDPVGWWYTIIAPFAFINFFGLSFIAAFCLLAYSVVNVIGAYINHRGKENTLFKSKIRSFYLLLLFASIIACIVPFIPNILHSISPSQFENPSARFDRIKKERKQQQESEKREKILEQNL